jgi:hypothetical protein
LQLFCPYSPNATPDFIVKSQQESSATLCMVELNKSGGKTATLRYWHPAIVHFAILPAHQRQVKQKPAATAN